MTSSRSSPRHSAQQSARVLLRALQGHVAATEPDVDRPGDDDGGDGGDGGDGSSRGGVGAARLLAVQRATLPSRVAAAIAEDTASVTLADGSAMAMAEAERHLAHKEQARVYAPLRVPMELARGRARDLVAERALVLAAEQRAGVGPVGVLAHELRALRAFVRDSGPLVTAALEVLRSRNDVIGDAMQLTRALDRPDPEQTNDVRALELVRLSRQSVGDGAMARVAAPGALLGHVVDDGERLRLGWGRVMSVGRYGVLAAGVGRLYDLMLRDAVDADVDADADAAGTDDSVDVVVARGLGGGLGLLLQAPPVWRALSLSRGHAEGLWRERVAAAVIDARLRAAIALAIVDGAGQLDPEAPVAERAAHLRDEARGAARSACGLDVGQRRVDTLLIPTWPDGVLDHGTDAGIVAAALDAAAAAAAALAVRDACDDMGPLRADGLRGAVPAVAGLRAPAAPAWGALLAEIC